MLSTLSSALDLVSPAVVNHQKKVAYIAGGLAREMGLPAGEVAAILLAGFLHDCGALSLQSKLDALRFDFDLADPHHHSEVGARFLAKLENSFADVASLGLSTLVRFHHVSWEHGRGESFRGQPVPLAAHLLHLADRVAVLVRPEREILGQSADIMDQVSAQAGRLFLPVQVQALKELASREHFWLALVFDDFLDRVLAEAASEAPAVLLDVEGLMRLAQVFAQVVDFRSRFTATHSSGVADVARALASLAGFSAREKEMMAIAGYLHDLGKLAVPKEILEKPGPLTMEEYNLVKAHPFHAYRLLSPLAPLDMVVPWACFHHEELGGLGYPFRGGRQVHGHDRGPPLPAGAAGGPCPGHPAEVRGRGQARPPGRVPAGEALRRHQ
jgi:HD-GYP domain-containing protein (c-di-GMP phosphodiesterase class II)